MYVTGKYNRPTPKSATARDKTKTPPAVDRRVGVMVIINMTAQFPRIQTTVRNQAMITTAKCIMLPSESSPFLPEEERVETLSASRSLSSDKSLRQPGERSDYV